MPDDHHRPGHRTERQEYADGPRRAGARRGGGRRGAAAAAVAVGPVLVDLLLGVPALAPLYCAQWLLTAYLPMDCRSSADIAGAAHCDYHTLDHAFPMMVAPGLTDAFVLALVVMATTALPLAHGRRLRSWLGSATLLPVPYAALRTLCPDGLGADPGDWATWWLRHVTGQPSAVRPRAVGGAQLAVEGDPRARGGHPPRAACPAARTRGARARAHCSLRSDRPGHGCGGTAPGCLPHPVHGRLPRQTMSGRTVEVCSASNRAGGLGPGAGRSRTRRGAAGPVADFLLRPGTTPDSEQAIRQGQLVMAVEIPGRPRPVTSGVATGAFQASSAGAQTASGSGITAPTSRLPSFPAR